MRRGAGLFRVFWALFSVGSLAIAATGCGGGGGGGSGSASGFRGGSGMPGVGATQQCAGNCDPSTPLDTLQVMTILDQGAREMAARGVPGTIAVVDRSGNPLAVWQSAGEKVRILITSNRPDAVQVPMNSFQNGFENTLLDGEFGALSKAITGAYLSSQGNAFSTRTANFIVNANFPPNNGGENSGPLFGVQFSQLPCGDWVRRDDAPLTNAGTDPLDGFLDGTQGPKRSPLGFSADPGGFPLYINGVVVGGIGVVVRERTMMDPNGLPISVSIYGVDGSPEDSGGNIEEQIALAAMRGFEPSDNRVSSTIAVMGRTLRYSNTPRGGNAMTDRAQALVTQVPTGGDLIQVPGFYDGTLRAGTGFGTVASGVVLANGSAPGPGMFGTDRNGRPIRAQILVNMDGSPFLGRNSGRVSNPRDSISPPGAVGLTRAEVQRLLGSALGVAQEARAGIRQPGGSAVQVNVHVCDRDGNQLGYARSPDAPLFGSDVALQKCRAAAIFSRGDSTAPPNQINSPDAAELFAAEDRSFAMSGASRVGMTLGAPNGIRNLTMSGFLQRVRDFIPDPNALADGTAFSNRAIGNLARPCFPDGVNCTPDGRGGVLNGGPNAQGPLSVNGDRRRFSPLADGFQLEYVKDYVVDGLLGRANNLPEPTRCGTLSANGFQIFPGSVPLYKLEVDASGNPTGRFFHVGGIGISGDGVDQDDMVAFLGVDRVSRMPGSIVMNAPQPIRASRVSPRTGGDTTLRFVNCPVSPFNPPFEDEQNVCEGR
jgi:uncharacterized protein GlcG (DUF336 family)